MIIFSECIENDKIRNDYLTLPLLHRKIRGEDLNPINKILEDSIPEKEEINVFLFCPSCGFNNEKQFKFCPKCGSALSS